MNERINFWISQPYCPVCDVWPFWPGLDPEGRSAAGQFELEAPGMLGLGSVVSRVVSTGGGFVPHFGPEYSGEPSTPAPPRTIRGRARFTIGPLQFQGQGRSIRNVRGRMRAEIEVPQVGGRAGTSMEDREEELILQLIMTE
jgi:hypothetical protein